MVVVGVRVVFGVGSGVGVRVVFGKRVGVGV